LRGQIEFRDVSFRYASGNEALRHIDLEILPGEVVALVGRSGAGKSTLIQLVPRLHDPTGGQILLDGRPLTDYSLRWLRDRIGVVPQNTFLFDRTIRENVAYGRPAATDAMILDACRAAHAEGFITRMPHGLDSMVGEGGVRLSGGEKQRLAIARELLRDPPILILDEATSNLDLESEALVGEALGRLMRGRTCLIIAHRLSTVRRADRIVVLDQGTILAQGTHSSLLAECPLYRELHAMQFRDSPTSGRIGYGELAGSAMDGSL
jgi:subfamily B ATP-binding cassette protein MsbA